MPANSKFSFSVVIPTYNEKEYLPLCLDSIVNQNYDRDLVEIIVVDGLSTDGTLSVIKKYQSKHSGIKYFLNSEKKTPNALNIGVKNSSGEVIVILGAHATLDKDFLYFNNKNMDEHNVKVSGGTQYNIGKSFIQKAIGIAMEVPFAIASAPYRWSKKEQFVDTVVYAAYKRELFEEIGFFEEKFSISEDAEINWRIRQAGYKIFFSPKIKSYYYPRKSILKFIKQIFRYGILRVNVVKKHFDAIRFFHLIPPIFVVTIILMIILVLTGNLKIEIPLIVLAIYFLTSILSSAVKLIPDKLLYIPLMPLLVFLMHFFWGLGFIVGLLLPRSDRW